jgi:FkbM family methyltransferase
MNRKWTGLKFFKRGNKKMYAKFKHYIRVLGEKLGYYFPITVKRNFIINGIHLTISDYNISNVYKDVCEELMQDNYNIESINFEAGDVVIDIGANIGIVSIYIAKKYPFIKIYSFEPIPDNYKHFIQNITLNNVKNIIPYNMAITEDGRNFDMIVHFENSGGATGQLKDMKMPGHWYYTVKSISLDKVFLDNQINTCRLLKIDCEGSEHEILLTTHHLNKIEYLSGEFHINNHLKNKGYSIESIIKHCQRFISPSKMKIKVIQMAE